MNDEIFYKVSYVVQGGTHPGAIVTVDQRPQVGETVTFDGRLFEILEVMELMPAIGNFGFLHVTCKYVKEAEGES